MAQIEITNVSKNFGFGSRAVVALDRVNLQIEKGSFVSLCGPSGCGKSTLLTLMLGLQAPSGGEIRINDQRVHSPDKSIGTVFQDANLMPWRTVLSNILYPAELRRLPKAQFRERALELLDLVGLRRFADHYPAELSGGMRQRVSICRALILDPDILLMDEPFSALDALTRDEMSLELHKIWSRFGKTVLFITHSIREAVFLSNRVVVMGTSPGRVFREFAVDLPIPRDSAIDTSPRFNELIHAVRAAVYEGHAMAEVEPRAG